MDYSRLQADLGNNNEPENTNENFGDGPASNMSSSMNDSKSSVKGGGRRNGPRNQDDRNENTFQSLQFQNKFGKLSSTALKIESDCNFYNDYSFLNSCITLKISIDENRLREQCAVFADNTFNQGTEHYRLTGLRGVSDQIQLFSDVYFYSFIKMYKGMINYKRTGRPIRSILFRGHAYLYKLFCYGLDTYIDPTGPNVIRRIDDNVEQMESVLAEFASKYLTARYAMEFESTDGNFTVNKYEVVMRKLHDGAFRLTGRNQLMVLDDALNFNHDTLLNTATCPLANCFYEPGHKKLYVASESDSRIREFSYIFNKASFLTFSSYNDSFSNESSPPGFLNAIALDETDYLIMDEVKFVTGLDCLNNRTNYTSDFYPKDINDMWKRSNIDDFGYNNNYFRPASENSGETPRDE